MNFRLLAGMASIAVVLQGCKHSSQEPPTQLPTVKITIYEVLKVPTGGGNIHVEGVGATPNSEVVMILNYSVGSQETEQLLKTVKSDNSGIFTYRGYQGCLFSAKSPSPTQVSLEARDAAIGASATTPDFDPTFLVCPK